MRSLVFCSSIVLKMGKIVAKKQDFKTMAIGCELSSNIIDMWSTFLNIADELLKSDEKPLRFFLSSEDTVCICSSDCSICSIIILICATGIFADICAISIDEWRRSQYIFCGNG